MNFVLYQFLWAIGLVFFLALGIAVIHIFTHGVFKNKYAPIFEILSVFTVFAYILAFHVNF
ncbi:MAG: hypothetical protein FWC00_00445 [Firmicutes bacterium]|nr:hypothetical protein [Bacillota bacterium]